MPPRALRCLRRRRPRRHHLIRRVRLWDDDGQVAIYPDGGFEAGKPVTVSQGAYPSCQFWRTTRLVVVSTRVPSSRPPGSGASSLLMKEASKGRTPWKLLFSRLKNLRPFILWKKDGRLPLKELELRSRWVSAAMDLIEAGTGPDIELPESDISRSATRSHDGGGQRRERQTAPEIWGGDRRRPERRSEVGGVGTGEGARAEKGKGRGRRREGDGERRERRRRGGEGEEERADIALSKGRVSTGGGEGTEESQALECWRARAGCDGWRCPIDVRAVSAARGRGRQAPSRRRRERESVRNVRGVGERGMPWLSSRCGRLGWREDEEEPRRSNLIVCRRRCSEGDLEFKKLAAERGGGLG
ncbi:uncharacterized protein A4U43_C05F9700 [Asparagus officinalis]|uniref:Uncharacterized protein n=1 Tax=Asparagus officinalis TaxID=4686 RepID=A0A5P1EU86_ASPOF|nr:uncharacterized protein A4U43_C05F9700 [Asparagus officinalis]